MTFLALKKRIRHIAARLGVLRPLRSLVFMMRGVKSLQSDLAWYARLITPGQLVFDVGANRGQSSEIFIQLGARVVAFEPQLDLHSEIRQLCKNSPMLTLEAYGIGDREETRRLYLTEYDQVASLRDDWEGIRLGESDVQISTLDKQIEHYGLPDYCKIDVEGWELKVFEGLNHAIPLISFEYHLSPAEVVCAISVLDRLALLGDYHCNLKKADSEDFTLSNFLPLSQFRALFPESLSPPLTEGYGDIICVLDPSSIRSS